MKTLFQYSVLKIIYPLLMLLCLYPAVSSFSADFTANQSFGYFNFIQVMPIWAQVIMQLSLFFTSLFIWINLAWKYKLVEEYRISMGAFFLFYFGICLQSLLSSMVIFAGLFLIFSIANFLKIYNQFQIRFLAFIASLLIALASFFYYPAVLVILLLWIGISIVRTFELKVLLISLIGFTLPFLYAYCMDYLGLIQFEYASQFFELISLKGQRINDLSFREIIFVFVIFLLVIQNFTLRSKMVVHQRNQMAFLILLALLAITIGAIYDKSAWYFAVIPGAVFAAKFYHSIDKKWIIESAMLILMGLNFIIK